MIPSLTWQKQLNGYVQQFTNKIQELQVETKKRKSKGTTAMDKQKQQQILTQHIELLKRALEKGEASLDPKQWHEFVQLLETLMQNLGNPDHEKQFKQVFQDLFSGKFKSSEKCYDLPLKTIEHCDLAKAQQQAPFVDQTNSPYKLRMLQFSYEQRPQGSDYYQPPIYKERLCLKSLLPKYPQLPYTTLSKLSQETLFYIFYYHKEPTERSIAIRQLQQKGWFFYSKHATWVKKKEKIPIYERTDTTIKGQFLWFDYEQTWQLKAKEIKMKIAFIDEKILEKMLKEL